MDCSRDTSTDCECLNNFRQESKANKFVYLVKRGIMILERTKDEILVRLPANLDLTELQNMIDYLDYKEQTMNSKISQNEVDGLSKTVNESIWAKFKAQRGIK